MTNQIHEDIMVKTVKERTFFYIRTFYFNCRYCEKPLTIEKRNYGYCGLTCFLDDHKASNKETDD